MRENDGTFWNFTLEHQLSSLWRFPFKLKESSSRLQNWKLLFYRGWRKKDFCQCKRLKLTIELTKLLNESTQKGSDFFSSLDWDDFRWGSKRNKILLKSVSLSLLKLVPEDWVRAAWLGLLGDFIIVTSSLLIITDIFPYWCHMFRLQKLCLQMVIPRTSPGPDMSIQHWVKRSCDQNSWFGLF